MSTQAGAALKALNAQYVEVPNNGMFNSYDHVMVCHGCGNFHAVRSQFISTPLSLAFKFADESRLDIPAHKCPTCPSEAIRRAWEKGVQRETFNTAASAIGAELWPESQPCRLCGAKDQVRRFDATGAHSLCVARAARGLATPSLGLT